HWPSICVVLLVATAPLSAPHSFPTRRSSDLTAGGVVFMTLEDETGFVNVVVWESVFDRYSLLAKTVNFLGITGTLQVEDGIVHLVADELWELRLELKPASTPSRDFHCREFAHRDAEFTADYLSLISAF